MIFWTRAGISTLGIARARRRISLSVSVCSRTSNSGKFIDSRKNFWVQSLSRKVFQKVAASQLISWLRVNLAAMNYPRGVEQTGSREIPRLSHSTRRGGGQQSVVSGQLSVVSRQLRRG